MMRTIRELPKGTEGKKKEEVDTFLAEYRDKFETEYTNNLKVLETFKNTEHLTKPAEDTASGN